MAKKVLLFLLLAALCLSLWSCGKECTNHIDLNGDTKCDICEGTFECAHKDENLDLKCELCSSPLSCTHKDLNNDGICDIEVCKWNYDHEHTYSSAWEHDKDFHWHNPSCSHTVEVKDKAEHSDEDNNGICDGCGWNYDHTHTYDRMNWCYNTTTHWYEANCGHDIYVDEGEHIDKNGSCSVCGYTICAHEFDLTKWQGDESGHWNPTTCGHFAKANVSTEHVDENHDNVCDLCEYDNTHDHRYNEDWSYDTNNHWKACTCCFWLNKDEAAHDDENNDGICDTCKFQFCTHTFDTSKYKTDDVYHWYGATCSHNVKKDVTEHIDVADNDGLCDICNYQMCSHTYEEEWSYDEENHWHASNCGHDSKDSYEEHVDLNGDFECDTCGQPYEDTDPEEPDDKDSIETPPHYIGGKPKN